MKRSLVNRAIPKETGCYTSVLLIFVGKRNSTADWDVSSNDPVSSPKVIFHTCKVHRSTFSFGATGCFPEQLSHALIRCDSANQSPAVIPVGSNDIIIIVQRMNRSG